MQQKIHMQDQVTNRVEIIINDQYGKIKQIVNEIATVALFLVILALRVVW